MVFPSHKVAKVSGALAGLFIQFWLKVAIAAFPAKR